MKKTYPLSMNNKPITALILDFNELYMNSVKKASQFEAVDDIIFSGNLFDEKSVYALLATNPPDILLIEVRGIPTPFSTIEKIRTEFPNINIIGMSVVYNEDLIAPTISAGGKGYISKFILFSALLDGIRKVYKGELLHFEKAHYHYKNEN